MGQVDGVEMVSHGSNSDNYATYDILPNAAGPLGCVYGRLRIRTVAYMDGCVYGRLCIRTRCALVKVHATIITVHAPIPSHLHRPVLGRGGRPLHAVVLLHDRDSRLEPLTTSMPIGLLEVAGVPLVERTVERLARTGITAATVVVCDRYANLPMSSTLYGVSLRYVSTTSSPTSISCLAPALTTMGVDDTVVVCDARVIDSSDIAPVIAAHESSPYGATMQVALSENHPDPAPGAVDSTTSARSQAHLRDAGTYIIEPDYVSAASSTFSMEPGRIVDTKLLAHDDVCYVESADYWGLVNSLSAYIAVNKDAARKHGSIHSTAIVHPSARITDSIVGPRCRVGPGVVIVDSILNSNSSVGPASRVVRSVLGAGSNLPPGQELVDAVVAY